jgi:hypothetical protein
MNQLLNFSLKATHLYRAFLPVVQFVAEVRKLCNALSSSLDARKLSTDSAHVLAHKCAVCAVRLQEMTVVIML